MSSTASLILFRLFPYHFGGVYGDATAVDASERSETSERSRPCLSMTVEGLIGPHYIVMALLLNRGERSLVSPNVD